MYSHNQLSTRISYLAQVASVIQPYIVLILTRSIIVSGLEAIREDGTIIRMVGRVRPGLMYQYTDAGRPEPQ